MKPSEHIIELKKLIGEAGVNYYRRITHATALLDDQDWIDSEYKGDKYKAAESLESQFFHDLCGAYTIWDLLQIIQKFPNIGDWKNLGYNLSKLFEASIPRVDKGFVSKRTFTIKEGKALQERVNELNGELKYKKKLLDRKDQRIMELEQEVAKLRKENDKLSKRLQELERLAEV